ncbi:MAG: hypothetical protein KC766_27350 [Myxococcales bacterium]|nr:hypothetical protein [Myxococcales bacterium]
MLDEAIEQSVRKSLGPCLLKTDYVEWLSSALAPHGFTPENTIACVATCRDELCSPFINAVSDAWGEAFNLSSLAGVPLLGVTGFEAALSHAPRFNGRERFLLMGMTHVGTDGGDLGMVTRPGQPKATPACGALAKLRSELLAGEESKPEFDDIDSHDVEMSLLRRRFGHLGDREHVPTLAELTQAAAAAISDELEYLVERCVRQRPADFCIATGILVHTPQGPSRVVPDKTYAVVRDARSELTPPAR